jgi:hypothetical protein
MKGLLLSICALAVLATALFADGGTVLSRQESGPFVITVFAAPVPIRAGPIDVTVLVQRRDSLEPVLHSAGRRYSNRYEVPGAK